MKSCFSCWLVVFDKIAELPSIEKKGEICMIVETVTVIEKRRPFRFKEGRCGDSSSSSDDDVLEEQVENFSLLIRTNVITVNMIDCVSNWIFLH